MDTRLTLGLVLVALALAAHAAEPPSPPPDRAEALPVQSDWKARAEAWYESDEPKARKKQMRRMTKALRKPCRHCHTKDWTGYTDRLEISRQMMTLSAEHGVPCADCHEKKKDFLTEL